MNDSCTFRTTKRKFIPFKKHTAEPVLSEGRRSAPCRAVSSTGARSVLLVFVLLFSIVFSGQTVWGGPSLELKDGDRVAFIGNTFFERDDKYARIETELTLRHPEKRIIFRNLGWSGDTVSGRTRSYFGNASKGFKNLMETVDRIDPTVIFVAYGSMEAYSGDEGLKSFQTGYERLLDELKKHTERIGLIGPIPHEPGPSPLPRAKVDRNNRHRRAYNKAVRELAADRGHLFIDLYRHPTKLTNKREITLTDDGRHRRGKTQNNTGNQHKPETENTATNRNTRPFRIPGASSTYWWIITAADMSTCNLR